MQHQLITGIIVTSITDQTLLHLTKPKLNTVVLPVINMREKLTVPAPSNSQATPTSLKVALHAMLVNRVTN